jgi:hypothetical protein
MFIDGDGFAKVGQRRKQAARGSGRSHKAWGGAQRNPRIDNPQKIAEPAERAIADDNNNALMLLSAASRAFNNFACGSWGYASLHPRLYAIVRYRGLEPRPG